MCYKESECYTIIWSREKIRQDRWFWLAIRRDVNTREINWKIITCMQIYEMHMACTRNRSLRVLLGLLTVPDWVKYDRLFQSLYWKRVNFSGQRFFQTKSTTDRLEQIKATLHHTYRDQIASTNQTKT